MIYTNALFYVDNASMYTFGILTSNVHMSWMRTLCGRLEMRYRYSNTMVYNTFPWPNPTDAQKQAIEKTAQGIRPFCIGKKNWVLIDTIRGAQNSAIAYSIAETAKANNLKPYEYFKYLLEEIPKYVDNSDKSFLDDLLPWSEKLPDECRKNK